MTDFPSRYTPNGVSEKGGFGEVIFCKDEHLNRPVAIKYIQNISQKKRIYDELYALLQMRSNHVVQVYDIIPSENDSIGIVEEFIEGENLFRSEFAKQSPDNYLKTLWQIASGIADIHEAGIIHRDIKPNNMKLDGEGVIKIFDFGLARPVGKEASTKGFKGTRLFAAPELYSADTVAFTRAIDTYAFGATALILATDSVPESLVEIPPSQAPKGFFFEVPIQIPDEISKILEKCLSSKPDDRPPMGYVRDEIARYLLHNKHQALVTSNGESLYLNFEKKKVRLERPDVGAFSISYNGLRFIVTEVSGEVYLNNKPILLNQEIPGSCVVSLGGAYRKASQRDFITFDVSHPEVVI